jgi:hypothetical protein
MCVALPAPKSPRPLEHGRLPLPWLEPERADESAPEHEPELCVALLPFFAGLTPPPLQGQTMWELPLGPVPRTPKRKPDCENPKHPYDQRLHSAEPWWYSFEWHSKMALALALA